MRAPGGITKPLIIGLLLAVVLYAGGFAFDQHLRVRRGPWIVSFSHEPSGDASLVVNQPHLGISNLKIVLAGELNTNAPVTLTFDQPERRLSWGEVVFEDLTYLPGTVTMQLGGHEIELLPRTLYLNRRPVPWQSNTRIVLQAADKLPATAPKRKTSRY